MDRQCPSCGGFCKKSGCERENKPMPGSIIYTNPPVEIKGDMTLRDYFAAKAMQGLLMGGYEDLTKEYWDSIPNDAYAMADAMLEQRTRSAERIKT